MDRRASLKSISNLFTKKSFKNRSKAFQPPITSSGLEPYTGPWSTEEIGHLLRRTTYGPQIDQFALSQTAGMDASVDFLLQDLPLPSPPLNHYEENDPLVPVGQTWVDAPYDENVNLRPYRKRSFSAWTLLQYMKEGASIREKMTLFWHNHYVVAGINDPKLLYKYMDTLRTNALGNFRELTKYITVDPSMLRYLNGNSNTKNAPNENYARELLELFTIGKGPQVGPGDYTNYTEDDIMEIARVLTGWRDTGQFSTNPDIPVGSYYVPNRHDTGVKQLSYRFDNIQIENQEEEEYKALIDIIFTKEEVARFICRKLYRYFVNFFISDAVEAQVILPLATIMIDNDYEVKPVLSALLKSAHFYDAQNRGVVIKNPLDFMMTTLKSSKVSIPQDDLYQEYNMARNVLAKMDNMQMSLFSHPSVAGWPAYYQEPSYYRIWINSVTLPYRMEFTDQISSTGYTNSGATLLVDAIALIEDLPNPYEVNDLIEDLALLYFPNGITEIQRDYLKNILIPGLPDYEWNIEYTEYLSNPSDTNLYMSIQAKLRAMLKAMMNLSEYYLQ